MLFSIRKTILKLFLVGTFHFAGDIKSIIHFFVFDFDRINVPSFILDLLLGHLQRNKTFLVWFEGHCRVQVPVVIGKIAYLFLS